MADTYGRPTQERERRRRATLTLGVGLLLVFFAAWYAWSYVRAGGQPEAAGATPSSSACEVDRSNIPVNVYNATEREGLAAQVAEQLEGRGFDVRTVANDPKKTTVTGVGQLRYGGNGARGAGVVAAHLDEPTMIEDSRRRPTVDVVLGPDHDGLVSAQRAAGREC